MFTRSLCSACAALLFTALVYAQESPEGHWEGGFTVNNREIGMSLDLAKNSKSEWIASMGLPSQSMTGLVVKDLTISGKSVSFVAVQLRMAKFNLTLDPDGKMRGNFSTPQGPVPVEFRRTGDAKVELIPASPAVSKELEGDWEGTLQTPERALRIVIHFKNQPDKTVAATIDTPDTGAMGLPLDNVKQIGQSVEFGIKVAEAGFKGTLNPECTELAGQWGHEGNSMPLTLRKK